jgi:hypothetical protein
LLYQATGTPQRPGSLGRTTGAAASSEAYGFYLARPGQAAKEAPKGTDRSTSPPPNRKDIEIGLVVTFVPKVTLRNPLNIDGLPDRPWLNPLRTKRTLLSST